MPGAVAARIRSALLALALGFAIAEGLLQLATLAIPSVRTLFRPVPSAIEDPVLGRRPNPAAAGHDASGFRNATRLERAEIVAIGDSQTYGAGVRREEAWPHQLSLALGTSVYSLSFGGFGPSDYYALLPDALALEPRTVFVAYYLGNDPYDVYAQVHREGRFPELRDAAADEDLAAAAGLESPTKAWHRMRKVLRERSRKSVADRIAKNLAHLRVVQLGDLALRALRHGEGDYQDVGRSERPWDEVLARIGGAPSEVAWPLETPEFRSVMTAARRAPMVDLGDPRIREGLRLSQRVLDEFRRACSGRCELRVLIVPTKERVFAPRVGAEAPDAYRALLAHERRYAARLGQWLASRGIASLDLAPALRRPLARGENPYYEDWDGHPNPLGHRAMAEAVAEWLGPRGSAREPAGERD